MQSSAKIAPVFKDGKISFSFGVNSLLSGYFTPLVAGTCYLFDSQNAATFTIQVNGVTVCSNSSKVSFSVNARDSISVTITRADTSQASTFSFYFTPSVITSSFPLVNYAASGSASRYLYAMYSNTTVACIDTSLLTLSNLKTITAIVNNGTSLTLTCNSHGFSNGNTISLIDVGGFSPDVNAKPFTLSNVTTNTFDITTTVTGTWDNNGYLAGAWVTNPIIATISLPALTGSQKWEKMAYRNADKTIYCIGSLYPGATQILCTINVDDSSGGFNTVKNWDKTVSNAYTGVTLGGSNAPAGFIHDPINDRFFVTNIGETYSIPFAAVPARVFVSQVPSNSSVNVYSFSYATGHYITSANPFYIMKDTILGVAVVIGINNMGSYSLKYNSIWTKGNGSAINRSIIGDSFTSGSSANHGGQTNLGVGCAIDSIDKMYFFRAGGSFNYGTTFDLMIWDMANNTSATREDAYIPNPSSGAGLITKANYSAYANKALAVDNGTSNGRVHVFDPTRASGKKYIGYVNVGGVVNDIALNHFPFV